MSALDELLRQWRSNPDADATIALCSYLGTSSREELIREVSTSAETWHFEDVNVMLAVGRMHLDAGLFSEAQAALVAAGKANGRDARVFRYLGEVLLRRGDAVRAEKVLARALQFDANDVDARLWHDRAVLYTALQTRAGVEAVAAEVRRALPKQHSIPPPTMKPLSHEPLGQSRQPSRTSSRASDSKDELPRFESEDPVRVSEADLIDDPVPRPAPVLRGTRQGMGPPGPKLPGLARPHSIALPGRRNPVSDPSRARPAPPAPAPPLIRSPERFEAITAVTPTPFIAPSWPESPPPVAAAHVARGTSPLPHASASPLAPVGAQAQAQARGALAPAVRPAAETLAASLLARPESALPSAVLTAPAAAATPDAARAAHATDAARAAHATDAPRLPASFDANPAPPEPSLVLEHLSRVGVYEPGGGAPPAWEHPLRPRTRGTWAISVAIVLIAGAGIGAYEYSNKVRSERMAHAKHLNDEVSKLLETGSVADLRQTDRKLNASFELDSLSQPAARLWLENRVLYQLLTSDDVRGIDAAVHRGQTVNLPEKESAFGRIASFMAEGDLAGGAATLSRWDAASANDPYYQLTAGAVLERAGDLRAIERYEAAARLDPSFVPPQLLLARLLLLEFGPERAKSVLDTLRQELGDAPITRALYALSWVVDPERSEVVPQPAQLQPGDAEKLPAPLSSVPSMVEAVQAMRAGDLMRVSRAIDAAVTGAMTPSLATELGFLAIEAGDEQLARKAALRALQFAAVYPRARTLAARVALLGGRLDEAQKAIEELDPAAPEVALVRGVVAYELLEATDLERAIHALGEAAHTRQAYAALAAGPGVLSGHALPSPQKLEAMATPATPWGELVAGDAALDLGELSLAAKILGRRAGDALQPVHDARLARLYRYQKKTDQALKAASLAREGSLTATVLIESVYCFLSNDDAASATHLIAKHPTALGPLSGWLAVLVDVASKQKSQASAGAAKLDLPPSETPLTLRVLVARALAAASDKRARQYVLALAQQVPRHPDVIEAALELR